MMLIFYCVMISVTFCSAYGSPIIKAPKKDMPYDNCVCEAFSCACCTTLVIPQIGINDTACISFAYLPKDYGIALILQIDNDVLINETISARNPPPICLPIPYIEDFVDICVHFTDLKIYNTDFHGCASLEARMWWVYVVAEFSLGCWDTSSVPNKAANLSRIAINADNVDLASGIGNNLTYSSILAGNMTKPSISGNMTLKLTQLLKSMHKHSVQDLYTNHL